MKGAGTDEDTLVRIIVCRSEVSGSKISGCRINPKQIGKNNQKIYQGREQHEVQEQINNFIA